MKNVIKYLIVIATLFTTNAYSQIFDPAVVDGDVSPNPLAAGGNGLVAFNFFNLGDPLPYGDGSDVLILDISFLRADANPPSITSVSGDYAGFFDWVYNPILGLRGTQNMDIPAFGVGTIRVGISITGMDGENSGFTATIRPPAYTNGLGDIIGNNSVQTFVEINTALPVEYSNISGRSTDCNEVSLTWETLSELNNEGFYVERSSDGKNYQEVGFVDGRGTSSILKSYSFKDKGEFQNGSELFYRLKQVDFDGRYSYSEVIKVRYSCLIDYQIGLFPNPTHNHLNIKADFLKSGDQMFVEIWDNDGKLIMKEKYVKDNFNSLSVDVSRLKPGLYYAKLSTKYFTDKKEFIKLL